MKLVIVLMLAQTLFWRKTLYLQDTSIFYRYNILSKKGEAYSIDTLHFSKLEALVDTLIFVLML